MRFGKTRSMERAGFGVSPLLTPKELRRQAFLLEVKDQMRTRTEPTADELAAVDRDQRRRKLEAFKKKLWSRQHSGEVPNSSAIQYATQILGRPVNNVDELTEDELSALMLSLWRKPSA